MQQFSSSSIPRGLVTWLQHFGGETRGKDRQLGTFGRHFCLALDVLGQQFPVTVALDFWAFSDPGPISPKLFFIILSRLCEEWFQSECLNLRKLWCRIPQIMECVRSVSFHQQTYNKLFAITIIIPFTVHSVSNLLLWAKILSSNILFSAHSGMSGKHY